MDPLPPPVQDLSPPDPAALERLQALLGELAGFIDWWRTQHLGADAASAPADSGLQGRGIAHTLQVILARALKDPGSLARHYAAFAGLALQVAQQLSLIHI